MTLIVIAVFGLALAALWWSSPAVDEAADVPDDVWAAFEASLDDTTRQALPAATGTALTTVGGLAIGESGFVSARATAVDLDGNLWLSATAVVHATVAPGRVAVRRDDRGYHLQRRVGLADLGWARSSDVRVRIQDCFD